MLYYEASTTLIRPNGTSSLSFTDSAAVPVIIASAGDQASYRFIEYFTATIRNPNTRKAYYRAVKQFFDWCDSHGLTLEQLNPIIIATYIEQLMTTTSDATVKQHLAAIRTLFDFLVTGQIVPMNPAASVRGPKVVIRKGKTPVLSAEQTGQLLESIPTDSLVGLRDRALIGVLAYSIARVSAVISMDVHTFRATGITTYLENGGSIEKAQRMAGHADAKTTGLYDRTSDKVSLDEIERIRYSGR